ncbi:hypothetical protein [Cohnella abietis]|uniref:Guanylate cyclase domain-containing protein n=1 Tax=Cohnella abietis TaxID=2507935 RepID=A0A3T1D7W6_9BACL|nr:hypothetical protein [Cohnella abietis]BBI34163.1 hypothetical protein KCTCHS21_35620 [Cohnella abietis]
MDQALSVKSNYNSLMEQSQLIVQQNVSNPALDPNEERYAVLHLIIQNTNRESQDYDFAHTQTAVYRFISVISQIVIGWGGLLIEGNHHAYTAIFPLSKPDSSLHSCICGVQIINAINNVILPSFEREGIDSQYRCAVGISLGSVQGIQTGLESPVQSLYYGEGIKSAMEYASMSNGLVIVDKMIKDNLERSYADLEVQLLPYRKHEWVGYQFVVGRNG